MSGAGEIKTMTEHEGLLVLQRLAQAGAWTPRDEDPRERARALGELLPGVPAGWTLAWVTEAIRTTGQAPSWADIALAWRLVALDRVASAPIPDPPHGVEAGSAVWHRWERARRAALISGMNADQATAHADMTVGGKRPVPASVSPEQGAAARERFYDVLTDVMERRRVTVTEVRP